MHPDEQQLSDVLSDFARTMVTEFPIQAILDELVGRIAEMLPVSSAGVTLISPGREPRYVAASDESALRYEKLQTELNQGPCVLAYTSGRAVTVPDLREEIRFPDFVPRALQAGMGAVFTFPLHHGDHQLGALDLYREAPGALMPASMKTAQTLADVAAAYLLNAEARADLQDLSDRALHATLHDGLTGLPNRVLLMDRLTQASARIRRSGTAFAVLYIDLDRFKSVNDNYGHGVGDALLMAVADRLVHLLRPQDTLARLAGDEFAVLCEDLHSPEEAGTIAERLRLALNPRFVIGAVDVTVAASVGVAYADRSTDASPEQMLHHADMAMYVAKRKGGHRQEVFSSHHIEGNLPDLERDLHTALESGGLRLEYQPVVAGADAAVLGFEALLRWDHPTRGAVAPSTFIPLAERSGLIVDIGRWVLRRACLDAQSWRYRHRPDLRVSVNVSPYQLMSAGFADTVAGVLRTTGAAPSLLSLEITESVFVRDSDRALLVLHDLKKLGVTIALDDFGTGYSSLDYLRRYPIDVVKIDRSVISEVGLDSANDIIVSAVIRLAHDLKMTVTAEGVETAYQHVEMRALGCDSCQGFYFARPMTASAIDRLLAGPVVRGTAPTDPDPLDARDTPRAQ